MRPLLRNIFTLSLAAACATALGQLKATQVLTGVKQPTGFYTDPADLSRSYVTQKEGQVVQFESGLSSTVLDLGGAVDFTDERGLLGLAFDPAYATSNRVYLSYVDNATKALRVVRTNGFDLSTAETIIDIPHPTGAGNHYGGTIRFGSDGKLYVSMGDGGGANDPEQDAQNLDNWLGKILRIDVSGAGPGYVAPSDNPFTGSPTREAIWQYGLRNPFKFSFDSENGDLYIGDVGQADREEIDRALAGEGGLNFGWPGREGSIEGPGDPVSGAVEPIYDYDRSLGGTVIGGQVYRGSALGSEFLGRYFFGDFVAGKVWSIDPNAANIAGSLLDHTSELGIGGSIVSIDSGAGGELYITEFGGSVYRVEAVPEPASLIALAGMAVLVRRRRRRV